MRKRSIGFVMLAMLTVFSMLAMTACNNDKTGPEPPLEPEETVYSIVLYYSNAEYLQTRNEELYYPLLIWHDEVYEREEDVYKATLDLLRHVPGDEYATMLTEDIIIRDAYAKLDEQTIFVDFASEGLSGGSQEEELLISQVIETLLHSFAQEGYSKVQLLVDGEIADTLMGHLDASQPFESRIDAEGDSVELE